MVKTILTPGEAKQARAAVGLSQSKVAKATGISRTNLALFEVKKYLLDDNTLTKLKQFYQEAGYSFSNNLTVEQPVPASELPTDTPTATGVRLMDGYAVPEGITEDEAESILTEILANDTEIESLTGQKSGVSWWTEEPKTEGLNRLLALHARNYVLTRQLQGHELLNDSTMSDDIPAENITNGMLFNKVVQD